MNRFENITKPLMWFMALLLTAFMAGCGGGGGSSASTPTSTAADKSINTYSIAWSTGATGSATGIIDQTLKTIKMTVPHATLLTPMTATFTATGVVTVGSVLQVSGVPTQSQSDFTLPVSYKVTAADGTWATYTVLVSRDQTVTSLAITPATATTPKGATFQFAANATYLDASIDDVTTTASWTPDLSGNARVGLHTGLAVGDAVTPVGTPVVITADFGGQTATAALTVTNAALVSIAVTPATGATTPVGGTQQFVATGTYTDTTTAPVTTTASWTSSAGATIQTTPDTTPGLATGVSVGTVNITAALSGVTSPAAVLTVTAPPGPNLLRTASFAVLAGTSITSSGSTTVTGDVGAASLTGAALANGTGLNDTSCATTACQNAIGDLTTVLSEANNTTSWPCGTSISGNLTGVPLTPGVTCISADAAILNTGIVTLNGPGVYIIRTAGGLTPAASSSVAFGGTATNANTTVFWVVGSANIGSPSTWMGTILSSGAVIVGDLATLNKGRVFTPGPITLSNNNIVKP